MASSPRTGTREEEGRLNVRTLTIASVASATAAGVTSQLWIAGTWIAAAVTPLLVTLISELLNRPTERIAQKLTSDSPAVPDPEAPRPRRTTAPKKPVEVAPDPDAPPPGEPGPVRVYRQPSRRPSRRRIALGVVAATTAIAFVVGIVLFTTTELLAGESIGRSGGRTTLFSGSSKNKKSDADEQRGTSTTDTTEQQQRQPTQTTTERQEQQPRTTQTTTTPTTTEQQTTEPPAERVAPQSGGAESQTAPAP
jgi:hypothetical protein